MMLGTKVATRLKRLRHDPADMASLIICVVLFALIAFSLAVHVQRLHLGISLWNDEALLAENIVGKSTSEMLTPPLSNLQTAPALYLLIVKALVSILGPAEWVLRLYSLVVFVLLLIVQAVVLRKVFGISVMLVTFSVALSSVSYFFLDYSTQLKPYMGDALFSVLVILLYWVYRQGRIGPVFLGLTYSVILLLSTPAAFFAAAVIVVEFLTTLGRRNKRAALRIVLAGVIVAVVFVLNYVLWLSPIANDPAMTWFWHGRQFGLRIWDPAVLEADKSTILALLSPLAGRASYLTLALAVCGAIVSLAKRNIYTLCVAVAFSLLVIASVIGKYPIQDRLWMPLFAWVFMFAFVFLSSIRVPMGGGDRERLATMVVSVVIGVTLLIPYRDFADYGKGADWTLIPGNKVNPLIEYVQQNIEPGETLYSTQLANVVLKYKIGYDSSKIGNASAGNVLWGADLSQGDGAEVARIENTGGTYVLFYHSYYPLSGDPNPERLIQHLQGAGYMDLIMDEDYTPLYWFSTDLSKVKASATLTVPDLITQDGTISGTFTVTNTGKTVFSADGYGGLSLTIREVSGSAAVDTVPFGQAIPPGATAAVPVDLHNLKPGVYEADLACQDEYSFSDLGLAPLRIVVS